MAAWGEEWAEEEELPTSYEQPQGGSAGGGAAGGGGGSVDSSGRLSSDVRKQVQQASEREKRLKVEKRRSKQYG